jgi:hypothetical protein
MKFNIRRHVADSDGLVSEFWGFRFDAEAVLELVGYQRETLKTKRHRIPVVSGQWMKGRDSASKKPAPPADVIEQAMRIARDSIKYVD